MDERSPSAGKRKRASDPLNVFVDANRRFQLPRPLRFRGASARLAPDAEPLLDVIARIVRENPEIRTVRIRAFWDTSLAPAAVAKLTSAQAEAIRDALLKRGVPSERLVAEGQAAAVASGAGGSVGAVGVDAARSPMRRVELSVQ
jgi:outer membrane protein OmpA-like peptidoglycan-associated protein